MCNNLEDVEDKKGMENVRVALHKNIQFIEIDIHSQMPY